MTISEAIAARQTDQLIGLVFKGKKSALEPNGVTCYGVAVCMGRNLVNVLFDGCGGKFVDGFKRDKEWYNQPRFSWVDPADEKLVIKLIEASAINRMKPKGRLPDPEMKSFFELWAERDEWIGPEDTNLTGDK